MMTSYLKNAVLPLLFIMLSACSTAGEGKRSMLYKAAISNGETAVNDWSVDTIEIDYENSAVRYSGGRVVTELSTCRELGWFCISDGNLEFAIRKDWGGSPTSWTHQDMTYSVIEESDPGQVKAYFILASPKEISSKNVTPKVYLYSKEQGILGITQRLRGSNGALVSVSYTRVKD